ncbi:MAG: DUF4129 domain-containing protein [Pseudomonadota bacterium]
MNLDNVTAELRPRSAWEAADFGVRLVYRDAGAIYRVWFASSLPLLALALLFVYTSPWPGIAFLIYWWLEPALDGPMLDVIARRLFGGDANVAQTVRSVPRLAWRNRLFLLTPKRLHFARSVAMPITQLEGQKGAARRQRSKVLNAHVLNHGMGITVAYHHLYLAVYFGIVLGLLALIPPEYRLESPVDWIDLQLEFEGRHASAANLLLFYFAQSLLEPWFVGAGFGLYINCRTRLEAWDIELAFRRMVGKRAPAAVAVLLAVGFLGGLGGSAAYAQESAEGDPGFSGFWDGEEVADELDAVFESDALRQTEERESWVRKNPPEQRDRSSQRDSAFSGFIEALSKFFALLVEFGLWILVALLLGLLFLNRHYWLPYLLSGSRPKARRQRVMLATGEVSADVLPDDVPGTVRALWQQGEEREALSLLYRASVYALVDRHGVRLPVSATEGACLAAVAKQTDQRRSHFFRRIVDAWVLLAYGARRPAADEVERLCAAWPQQYGEVS